MQQMEEKANRDRTTGYCCGWRERWQADRRVRRIRIGILFVLMGGLWLGVKMGLFERSILWPLIFITIGAWIMVSVLLRSRKKRTDA